MVSPSWSSQQVHRFLQGVKTGKIIPTGYKHTRDADGPLTAWLFPSHSVEIHVHWEDESREAMRVAHVKDARTNERQTDVVDTYTIAMLKLFSGIDDKEKSIGDRILQTAKVLAVVARHEISYILKTALSTFMGTWFAILFLALFLDDHDSFKDEQGLVLVVCLVAMGVVGLCIFLIAHLSVILGYLNVFVRDRSFLSRFSRMKHGVLRTILTSAAGSAVGVVLLWVLAEVLGGFQMDMSDTWEYMTQFGPLEVICVSAMNTVIMHPEVLEQKKQRRTL